ncbi:MAG: alpha-galactosidase, partial [Clostridia bacterium]|nr:alpha-galactosidase [Clostridia bacterium]
MYIRFDESSKCFTLETAKCAYVMRLDFDKYLTHLYYGDRKGAEGPYTEPHMLSFSPYRPEENGRYCIDSVMSEFPQFGSGDLRGSAIKVRNAGGDSVTMFTYKAHRIFSGRESIPGLPFASASANCETLEVTLFDEVSAAELKLYYTVYPDEDVISRYFTVTNTGENKIKLERAMSLSLDIPYKRMDVISFPGRHCLERQTQRTPMDYGNYTMESRRGATGHQMNNSFLLVDRETTETEGTAIAFSYVYSGSFMNSVEIDHAEMTRVLVGMHPDCFEWTLEAGETFNSPEAVMTLSSCGIGEASRNFHKFINSYVLRPCCLGERPVVLNTWEGNFFDIDENVLYDYAVEAKKCGIDMLVMDDGWFGKRYHDRAGLGDWQANPERFKDGLAAFVRRIKSVGINFGIWIEPEMVNPDSDLYRAHPEWLLCAPGRDYTLSRNQALLDFANPDVVEYLKATFAETFKDVDIDYIKWDFNRHLSEVSSAYLPAERRGETYHRFMLGVYDLYQWFCDKFPNVMIENCSGGGGRYDLGMMKYSSLIWTSDNTNPDDRIMIQYGSSMIYPQSVMSCHVSNHSNSIEDPHETDYRWKVAMQGMLGYEFDITKASDEAKATIKRQVEEYRKIQSIITGGKLYRLISPYEGGKTSRDIVKDGKCAFYYISEDGNDVVVYFYQMKGEEPREYLLKIDVPADTTWIAPFNRHCPYRGLDLRYGLSVRSSREDHYAEVYHFYRDRSGDGRAKAEAEKKREKFFEGGLEECVISDKMKAVIDKAVEGNDNFKRIVRDYKCSKITSLDCEGKDAVCFTSPDNRELFVVYHQDKGETPKEYRLRLDVPELSRWTATLNRDCPYHGFDLRYGMIVRSSTEDDYTELFHFK